MPPTGTTHLRGISQPGHNATIHSLCRNCWCTWRTSHYKCWSFNVCTNNVRGRLGCVPQQLAHQSFFQVHDVLRWHHVQISISFTTFVQNIPSTPRYCQIYKGSITARVLYHQAHQDIYQAVPTMYAQNMYQVLLGSTRYRRVYAQDLIPAHPNSGHPGLPSTQLEPTMKPMGAKYSGCIQAHF